MILSQSDPPIAVVVVQKILENVTQFYFEAPDGKKLHLSLSCGIAMFPVHANSAANLLRARPTRRSTGPRSSSAAGI